MDSDILVLGNCENGGGDVFWLVPPKPRGVPKGGPLSIENGDGGALIKEHHVFLIAQVP